MVTPGLPLYLAVVGILESRFGRQDHCQGLTALNRSLNLARIMQLPRPVKAIPSG
jgi:hypothetical protein